MSTGVPLRGRLTPPATLAQGRMQLKHVKGAERRVPWFGANIELTMPRAACAELIALCCAVLCACWRCHVLIGRTCVNCGRKKTWGPREDNRLKKAKRLPGRTQHVHTTPRTITY